MPFLLRESGNAFVLKEPQSPLSLYRLVGELFVQGVMDGEIVEGHSGTFGDLAFIE
jgi:hypothetical protein